MAQKVNLKTKKKSGLFSKLRQINISFFCAFILLPVIPVIVNLNNNSLYKEPHAAEIQPLGQTSGWHMILSDEFNTTTLNTSLWTPGWFGSGITGPIDSSENACYDGTLATLPGDGNLHLKLINQSNTCGGASRTYTGSMISSNPSDGVSGHTGYQYTYGYAEYRVYLPASSAGVIANWPGTWTNGQSWPTTGEDDVMEGLDGQACFHFHSSSGGPGNCVTGDYTGWHTFGSDWEPGVVTYYYDGIQVGQITLGITSAPMYLAVDNTISGSNTTHVLVPDDMLVDYVRVWQKCTSSTCPTDTPSGSTDTPGVPTSTPVISSPTPTLGITDATPPTVSITSPLSGTTVSRNSTVTIQASAIDNTGGSGISKVLFAVNGTTLCTVTTTPYSCSWKVPGAKGKQYKIIATAYDNTGNTSSSTITVKAQ